ncbi:MAG: hypothetical protein RLZZ624_394 [Cyanobacteriota bacterium]
MNDHALGQALRAQVLQELQHGRRPEPSRLQAVLSDWIASEQEPLRPALRALIHSAAFSSAIQQQPPLADGRLMPRLREELAPTFSREVRQRMETVLAGLLDQPPPFSPSTSAAPVPANSSRGGGGGAGRWAAGLVLLAGVLAVAGGVAMALLGGGVALWLRHRNADPQAQAEAQIPPTLPPVRTPAPAPEPADGGADQASAVQSLNALYRALSDQDAGRASQYYGPESSDQFDPAFFRQFAGVTLSELQLTGRRGPVLSFSGVVTFTYPDGSSQIESRSFDVDTSRSPAVVTASAFGRILQLRR